MTAGSSQSRPGPPAHNETSKRYFAHSSADRINTDAVIVDSLRAEYPQLHLTVVPQTSCDLIAYAQAGHAGIAPIDKERDRLGWRFYVPPASRLSGGRGILGDKVSFGKFLIDWGNREFVVYVVNGRDGGAAYPVVSNQYILSSSIDGVNQLLLEAGLWNNELHDEVWVFDGGWWQKSAELWDSVQKSSWSDVILDEGMKKALINDVDNFFDSRATYERLKVPWKRGIIYYGPPGNGKTISIKAMMHALYSRKDPIPTLYVRSLAGFGGPEYSLNQIFTLARRTAPCYLVFEDLDSIVTDSVRSYFLNEVDGIKKNDGILMIGSTNHLDRLDPGISKRPSRFDRKYLFPNPDEGERAQYMKYWQAKLKDNDDLDFPDKLCPAVAKITDGFSFAYMQEAMVASLLAIAREDGFAERSCMECLEPHDKASTGDSCDRDPKKPFKGLFDYVWLARRIDEDDPSLDNLVLWREIKKQVRILREEMGGDDK
ncbi:P-loop containing nucleoside triphosphate hydrolase protein [Polychaeton citri CBS 116435]|uniref:P-loop containing nucleoside triphosphate hydrolase protein n=1 Tax=Polychaeton citri CBS 116435 TaxID=1314669 RepID=A0A9P4Q0Q4_9PEZI|nr:P-loop containing nucleoside triphosphate hydrolase protein [Polychaeton citri CBS 116435]